MLTGLALNTVLCVFMTVSPDVTCLVDCTLKTRYLPIIYDSAINKETKNEAVSSFCVTSDCDCEGLEGLMRLILGGLVALLGFVVAVVGILYYNILAIVAVVVVLYYNILAE